MAKKWKEFLLNLVNRLTDWKSNAAMYTMQKIDTYKNRKKNITPITSWGILFATQSRFVLLFEHFISLSIMDDKETNQSTKLMYFVVVFLVVFFSFSSEAW